MKTPKPRNPWNDLADQLAELRKQAVKVARTAHACATYGPVAIDSPLSRGYLAGKFSDHLGRTGTALVEWEKAARNEAARLEVRSHRG